MTVGAEVLVAGSGEYESARRSEIAHFDGVRPHAVVLVAGERAERQARVRHLPKPTTTLML